MTRALITRIEALEARATAPAQRVALIHAIVASVRLMDGATFGEAAPETYVELEAELLARDVAGAP